MSKPFPALRFHGPTDACARHIKRGLLELFKTEELQKRMGVPILRRTVEVSDYTTIMVHIAQEQTFVHITSNPPELPELITLEEEKEPEFYGCPSAFLIRKRVRASPGINTEDEADGYLIGYDHRSRRWRVVSYKPDTGETVAFAGNLGWYDIRSSETGTHTHCDVITWKGQASPNFSVPYVNIYYVPLLGFPEVPIDNSLASSFYFQGREFSAPSLVVGACILPAEENIDYVYLHTVSLTETHWGGSGNDDNSYSTTDRAYRKKLSEVLSESGGWQQINSNTNIANTGLSYHPNFVKWMPPRACSYVDKEGISYFVREYMLYGAPDEVLEHDGAMAFISFNLKTGAYDVLSSSETSVPTGLDVYTPGDVAPHDAPGGSRSRRQHWDNTGRPWVFYVWPGTQDLYHAALEIKHDANGILSLTGKQDMGSDIKLPLYSQTSSYVGHTDLIIYKNFKEIDRMRLVDYNEAISMENSWTSYVGVGFRENCHIGTYQHDVTNISLFDYHPEIKKSKRYLKLENYTGYTVITYIDDYLGTAENVMATNRLDYETWTDPVTGHVVTWSINVPWLFLNARIPEGNSENLHHWASVSWGNYNAGAHLDPPQFYSNTLFSFSLIPYEGLGSVPPLNETNADQFLKDQYVSTFHNCFCLGLIDSWRDIAPLFGSATGMDYLSRYADGANNFGRYWKPCAYALHRPPTGAGEKPFLYLRRNIYVDIPYRGQVELGYVDLLPEATSQGVEYFGSISKIYLSDKSPQEYNPNTDHDFDAFGFYTADKYLQPFFRNGEPGTGQYNREGRWIWSKPTGHLRDPDDPPSLESFWDDEAWTLLSNFTSSAFLNKLTKEEGLDFFDIGVL